MFYYILTALVIIIPVYLYQKVQNIYQYWDRKGVRNVKPELSKILVRLLKPSSEENKVLSELTQQLYNHYPNARYHGIFQFLVPTLVLKCPELIKQITIKDFEYFTDHRTLISADIDPVWNRNLFAATGARWRRMRTVLSPSFTSAKLRSMYALIEECAKNFTRFHIEQIEANNKNEQILEIEIKDALSRFTNDVIASTAFGVRVDSLHDRENLFYTMGKKATDFSGVKMLKFFLSLVSPALTRLLRVRIIQPHVAEYFQGIVEESIRVRTEHNQTRTDMIQLLLDAKNVEENTITNDDIVSQALIFFLAGFETVSTVITALFYELALNVDVQDRLRAEINDQLDDDGCTYEKVLNLEYLEAVMCELMRKWPATILSDRVCTKPYTIEPLKGVGVTEDGEDVSEKPLTLDVGTIVWLPTYALQHDEKYYPEPERFDPGRFEGVKYGSTAQTGTYFPFGIGQRNCIGSRFAMLEIKLLIVYLLRRFEVVRVEKTVVPLKLDSFGMKCWIGLKKI